MSQALPAELFFTYESFLGCDHWLCTWGVCVGSAVLYLLLVYAVWPRTRPSGAAAAASMKTLRKWHNVVLFFFSAACSLAMLYHVVAINGLADFHALACAPVPRWVFVLQIVFTLSKLYEWFDTYFLVALSRPADFLHVYHHATTFWLFLHVTNFPSTLRLGVLLNGGVHTLMYAHYAWPFPKRIVPLITASQIAQLVYVTYVWSITPRECPAFASFPERWPLEFATPYAFVPVYTLFFVKYFAQRWISRTHHKAGAARQKGA